MNWWLKSAWLAGLLAIGSGLILLLQDNLARIVMAGCTFAVFTRRAWIFTQ
jgi:hypothetical protein